MCKYLSIVFIFIYLSSNGEEVGSLKEQLNNCSITADNYFNSGKLDSSLIFYTKAIQLATQLPDSINLSILLRKQANIFELKGNFSPSLKTYLKAINNAKHTGQIKELGLCYLGLSNVNYRIFNTESALSNSIEASKIFKNLNDTSNYIHASELIAQVYISLEKYNDALIISNEMLTLAKSTNDSSKWASSLNMLGAIYSFKHDYDNAFIVYQEAASINKILGNKIYEGINLGNLGEIYLRKGLYQNALSSLFEALEIEQKQEFNSGIIYLYYTIGETYSNLKMNNKAMSFFEKSLALIEKLGEIREKPTVYKLIAEHYARNDNYYNAYQYYKYFDTTKDSLNRITASFKVEEMKAKFEIDKKDHELELLINEKSIQEKELVSKKNLIRLQLMVILLVLAGLISSFIFAVYFFNSRAKLKSTNKTKDILFSIIGHDLRGPMGNIKQIVEAIQSPDLPEREKYIQMLTQPTNATFLLLDDLLAWSRTLDNKITYNPRLIPVNDAIEKTYDLLKSQADKKNILLTSIVPTNVLVFAEYNHVLTILRNLVSNAIKFTPEKGTISISHLYENNLVKILVTDTGIGIEPQNIKKIFDSNSFFSTFGTNNERGSGLGLVLCQKFIKLNEGKFGIESTLGKGSTFYFTLPRASQY